MKQIGSSHDSSLLVWNSKWETWPTRHPTWPPKTHSSNLELLGENCFCFLLLTHFFETICRSFIQLILWRFPNILEKKPYMFLSFAVVYSRWIQVTLTTPAPWTKFISSTRKSSCVTARGVLSTAYRCCIANLTVVQSKGRGYPLVLRGGGTLDRTGGAPQTGPGQTIGYHPP